MNLRQLGGFLILLGLIGGAVSVFHYFPSDSEKFDKEASAQKEARAKEMAAIDRVLWLRKRLEEEQTGQRNLAGPEPIDRTDYSLIHARWMATEALRKKTTYIAGGIGGFLLLVGLVCVASQNSNNHENRRH